MKAKALSLIRKLDWAIINLYSEQSELTIVFLHKLFKDKKALEKNQTMPHEGLTVKEFDKMLQFLVQKGYTFLSPYQAEELIKDSSQKKSQRYALITFDDGYFNNTYSLPVLEKYNAPALFFISTAYTKENQPYWWDILYRETVKTGKNSDFILNEVEKFKKLTREKIYTHLEQLFGKEIFKYQDLDRPLTIEELKEFASHPLVFIGNHTHEHYALANWGKNTISEQLQKAQQFLELHVGRDNKALTRWVAYPNGSCNEGVLQVMKKLGFSVGVGIDTQKNYLPLKNQGTEMFQLGRINMTEKRMNPQIWKTYREDRKPIIEHFLKKNFQSSF